MPDVTKVCYFVGCETTMTGPTESIAEGMFLTHIQLAHMSNIMAKRTARLNSIQAKAAEDNMKRYEKLVAAGLKKEEVVSLLGTANVVKFEKFRIGPKSKVMSHGK